MPFKLDSNLNWIPCSFLDSEAVMWYKYPRQGETKEKAQSTKEVKE